MSPRDARTPPEDPDRSPDAATRPEPPAEEELQGPPPREATILRSDRERAAMRRRERTHTGPELTGGDVDADWERADSVGEEAVGGTVAVPDQSVVDELGDALGVPRAPDAEFRTSAEILDGRDRYRAEQEDTPGEDDEEGAAA
jgi:hypothetical protein